MGHQRVQYAGAGVQSSQDLLPLAQVLVCAVEKLVMSNQNHIVDIPGKPYQLTVYEKRRIRPAAASGNCRSMGFACFLVGTPTYCMAWEFASARGATQRVAKR